jgi:hypothetical protein
MRLRQFDLSRRVNCDNFRVGICQVYQGAALAPTARMQPMTGRVGERVNPIHPIPNSIG